MSRGKRFGVRRIEGMGVSGGAGCPDGNSMESAFRIRSGLPGTVEFLEYGAEAERLICEGSANWGRFCVPGCRKVTIRLHSWVASLF